MKQYYRIADVTVEMDTFGRTLMQAEPYRVSPVELADMVVKSQREKLKARFPDTDDDLCEYIATGASFYKQLLKFDGMMLHSSAVVMDGVAYLFTAPGGTGKSTHTALWLKAFGSRAFILNDDKPAIRLKDGAFWAYGTPWSGKTDQNVNTCAPIGGICILSRGEENAIERVYGKNAMMGIFSQTVRPQNQVGIEKVLFLLDQLIGKVPIYHLSCNMTIEAAHVAYTVMTSDTPKC